MATDAKKIPIKKIITDPKYYPRSKVDQKRILEFVEAMECDEHFPPIKVVYDKKAGMYVLLDGKHRLEACILRDEIDILADIFLIPKEHWLMASARFNGKSSKPLKGEEVKQIIIQTWLSGIKDTEVIAREMNVSVRYVEKVLKPFRDEERDKRKEEIMELHQQGMSQRKIASKIGLSFCCINSTIKLLEGNNEEACKNKNASIFEIQAESPEKDQVIYKRTEFVFRSLDDNNKSKHLDSSPNILSFDSEAATPQSSVKNETEKDISDQSIQNPNEDVSGTPDAPFEAAQMFNKLNPSASRTLNEGNDIKILNDVELVPDPANNEINSIIPMEMQSHETASDESVFNISEDISEAPGEYPEASAGINAIHELIDSSDKSSPNCESETPISQTQTAPPPVVDIEPHNDSCPVKKSTPYPSYLDQIDAYNEFPAHSQHAIRAMELAKHYKMDIVDIAKEINEPLIWIRKVMLSAMALSLMRGDKIDDASRVETLMGIEFNVIQCIQRMLVFQKMLDPISRDMECWVKNNLSQQDLDLLLSLVETNQNDFPHLLKGEAPPPGTKRYQKLPDSYKDRLQVCIAVFRELRDHTKNDRFNSGAAKQLTGHLNKNVIVINEIFDGLRERNLL